MITKSRRLLHLLVITVLVVKGYSQADCTETCPSHCCNSQNECQESPKLCQNRLEAPRITSDSSTTTATTSSEDSGSPLSHSNIVVSNNKAVDMRSQRRGVQTTKHRRSSGSNNRSFHRVYHTSDAGTTCSSEAQCDYCCINGRCASEDDCGSGGWWVIFMIGVIICMCQKCCKKHRRRSSQQVLLQPSAPRSNDQAYSETLSASQVQRNALAQQRLQNNDQDPYSVNIDLPNQSHQESNMYPQFGQQQGYQPQPAHQQLHESQQGYPVPQGYQLQYQQDSSMQQSVQYAPKQVL